VTTKGIDIASPQAGIDLGKVHAAGYDFVIVKAGGYNVKPLYVAPHYHEQIDAAIESGLKKGHYWIIGQGDPITEADYFVDHLYRFDPATDVLALDNERLDSNAALWGDAQITAFAQRVISRTKIHPHRFLLYMGAYTVREGSFKATNKLGISYWVASYGANDGNYTTPDLGGKWPRFDVHQFWSAGSVAGHTVDVDYLVGPKESLFTDPIEKRGYYRGSDGKVYAVDPNSGTKTYITKAQWAIIWLISGKSTKVSDYRLGQFKTV
jgi:GH25 family lysozyme M1 (1,4-beta-N-acetylmuramidase)